MEKQPDSVDIIFCQLEALEPKPMKDFVPVNADEQKALFLSGEIRNPQHLYDRIEGIDFDGLEKSLDDIGRELSAHPYMNPKHTSAYLSIVRNYQLKNRLMRSAREYKSNDNSSQDVHSADYMRANVELYGKPDITTYYGLVAEAKETFDAKDLIGELSDIRNQLLAELPTVEGEVERFQPSEATIARVNRTVNALYGGLLNHVPEREEKFSAGEIAGVFERIIKEEFGLAAEDWRVELYQSTSINVVASEKVIRIPEDRKPVTTAELRKLVVHEIGVHMLRSLMGDSLDVKPLRVGLSDYMDSEEGLAKVTEQALSNKFEDAGVPYYLAAGAIYIDGKDFRDTYEMMWRYNLLSKKKITSDSEQLQDEIAKSKDLAYRQVFRITRGTDDLPLFKDLAYYNGVIKIWEYLEEQGEDITTLLMLYMGKADPTNSEHHRTLLDSKTVVA